MAGLRPPRINTQDVGAVDVSESSDDHFSSASEGTPNPSRLSIGSNPQSPIPITRVERVDDKAAHGEVPGTPAYELRTQDAVPDEIEIVPEGRRSRSATQSRSRSNSLLPNSRPQTPGGTPVPKTVVEKVDDKPSYGEVDGTLAKELRLADAEPDEVRRAPAAARDQSNGSTAQINDTSDDKQAFFRSMWEGGANDEPAQSEEEESNIDNDFGDDFDEFAEEGEDEDFGDFDEAEATPVPASEEPPLPTADAPNILPGLPPPQLKVDLSGAELEEAIAPYLDAMFPDSSALPPNLPPIDKSNSSPFLSDRSLSLWQQLVSPPPMQPPNWTRSRIRRLFLVSLGVPVDLDEILPPSKQKRLILPNINLGEGRPSTSALDRLKQSGTNDSSTSIDSKTGVPRKPRRTGTAKGPPPPPDFDANAAALICRTTVEALQGYTDAALQAHLQELESLNQKASGVLEYWLLRKDEGLKEKEALEGVIENLVGFVKGRRGK